MARPITVAATLVSLACSLCACSEERATCLAAPLTRVDPIPPDTTCLKGGTLVHNGGDTNCNGLLDNLEISNTTVVCSEADDGPDSLVRVDPIGPGEACPEGGTAVRTGIDDNQNRTLEDEEIDSESFVCNGMTPELGEETCDGAALVHTGTLVVGDESDLLTLEGVTCIDGNVIISSPELGSLERLSTLEKITGDFLIIGNPSLASLDGLRALAFVGNTLMIQSNTLLTDLVGLESLRKFGALRIVGDKSITSLRGLENLVEVGGDIELNALTALPNLSGLEELRVVKSLRIMNLDLLTDLSALDALSRATGQLSIIGNDSLESFQLPIQRVDASLEIFENDALDSAEYPGLLLLGSNVQVRDNPRLASVSLPLLITSGGFDISNNPGLVTVSAPSLTYSSGEVRSYMNLSLSTLELTSLATLGGGLSLRATPALNDLSGLRSLASISGTFGVRDCASIAGFEGLGALVTINGNTVFRDNPSLTSFGGLTSLQEISGTLDILGNVQLPTSEAEAFSQRVTVGDRITISGNGPG